MTESGRIGTIVDQTLLMKQGAERHRRVATEERPGADVIEID